MMIKACFFDLDGTLLTRNKVISEKTKNVLMHCKQKGIQTYIATARPKTLDKMLPGWTQETFELFDGGVFCNGACCCVHGKTEYVFVDAKAVCEVLKTVEKYPGIHLVLQMENEVHAFNYEFDETHIEEWGLQDRKIVELDASCEKKTVKIMIYTNNLVNRAGKLPISLIEELNQKVDTLANLYLTDQGEVMMVMPKCVSKLSAIEHICNQEGFLLSEIAAFGDDMNDMEMLKAVGFSVAMGNGEEAVKKAARYITKTNDEDGIAYALETVLKII